MSSGGSVPDVALDELRELYRRLDEDLAKLGVECRACGRCCNFHQAAYTLYASGPELALVERESSMPFAIKADGTCGFQEGKHCTIRAVRPLGCRTSFCEEPSRRQQQELYETYLRRLKKMASRFNLAWTYRQMLP